MKDGAIVTQGEPSAIVNEHLVDDVFGLSSVIISDPVSNTPLIVPKGRQVKSMVRVDATRTGRPFE